MPARIVYLALAFLFPARHWGVVALVAALSGCSVGDAGVPWDTAQMAREIADDLRRFEDLDVEFRQVEVLGVRVVENYQKRPPPVNRIRSRSYSALVWVRVESRPRGPGWILVDAFRWPDEPWRRSIIYTEHRAPSPPPRPGEDATGTWHGYNRYSAPPTSEQVCAFAAVQFLNPPDDSESRLLVAELRRATWRRLTGASPTCRVRQ